MKKKILLKHQKNNVIYDNGNTFFLFDLVRIKNKIMLSFDFLASIKKRGHFYLETMLTEGDFGLGSSGDKFFLGFFLSLNIRLDINFWMFSKPDITLIYIFHTGMALI